jgi:uncharacterized membrane protein YphA (DoxX/SURF4 family)
VQNIDQYHEIIATSIARIFLGCLFFFQGYDAVFSIKIKNVVQTYENTFANSGIPRFLTLWGSWYTSLTALLGGAFLIFGLFNYITLFVLGINLILTAVGFGINTPVWDTRFVFPRLILILFLLIIPPSWHAWSLDGLFFY